MKRILFLLLTIISQLTIAQNTCSGLYTFPAQSCNRFQIGNGTTGSIKVCLEAPLTSSGSCNPGGACNPPFNGGGWPARIQVRTLGGTVVGTITTTTAVGTCFTLSTTDGYAELLGICLTGATVSWTTVNECGLAICDGPNPCGTVGGGNNNYIHNATNVDQCGVAFNTSNNGADGAYSSTQAGCGTSLANLDCNTTTSHTGTTGNDVPWSIENDIWYRFCPQVTGSWTITITGSNCSNSGGYQMALFQGTPSNLHTRFYASACTQTQGTSCVRSLTGTTTVTINVTNTTNCVYMVIDGHAGAVCNFSVQVTTTVCDLPLPVSLVSFTANKKDDNVVIKWITASESNSDFFVLSKSEDAVDYKGVCKLDAAGNSNFNTYYSCTDDPTFTTYYLLEQYDYNGNKHNYGPIVYQIKLKENNSFRYYNLLGNYMGTDYFELSPGVYICVGEYDAYKIIKY